MKVNAAIAVVTGAASGLGAATAKMLAREGASVALLDHNAESVAKVAIDLNGLALTCDVTSAEAVAAAFSEVNTKLGAPRILVNCAGIATGQKILGKKGVASLDTFERVIQVNLVGTFNMIRLFAESLAEQDVLEGGERGVIINTASVAAYEGQIGQCAYSASKAGVVGMTLPVARELAEYGIRACTIAPGIFETQMLKGLPEAVQESLGTMVPFPARLGRDTEFADLVMHIIANQMLNGETIRLDGAIRMSPK